MLAFLLAMLLPGSASHEPLHEPRARAGDVPWQVGRPLPHVHLPRIDGGAAVDLADFRGKKLLLVEFASW